MLPMTLNNGWRSIFPTDLQTVAHVGLPYGGFPKWVYPQIIYFKRMFHHKPSIVGYSHFRKPPHHQQNMSSIRFEFAILHFWLCPGVSVQNSCVFPSRIPRNVHPEESIHVCAKYSPISQNFKKLEPNRKLMRSFSFYQSENQEYPLVI